MRHRSPASVSSSLSIVATLATSAALALMPVAGHAADISSHIAVTCSDALTIDGSDSLSLHCAGNLSLIGDGFIQAMIEAKDSLSITASGDVLLSHLALISPVINIRAELGSANIASDVLFSSPATGSPAPDIQITVGTLPIQPPRYQTGFNPLPTTLTPLPEWDFGAIQAVPEPASWLMLAIGLSGLGRLAWRRRAR